MRRCSPDPYQVAALWTSQIQDYIPHKPSRIDVTFRRFLFIIRLEDDLGGLFCAS